MANGMRETVSWRDLPHLLRKNEKASIILHQYNAPSHVSNKTIACFNESENDYVKFEACMLESFDISVMTTRSRFS
jgi:hypothetical protein